MKFINLAPDLSEVWDKVVYASHDAWLFHLYDWLQLTERIWALESESFLVEHQGKIIGVFPLQMDKNSRILKSIFMGTGGAAVKNDLQPSFREKVLKSMYEHVEEIAHENGSPNVEVYLPPLSESSLKNVRGVNPLVNHFYSDISTHSWIIDLSRPKDEIYKNMSRNVKREIKEAIKKGYKIRQIRFRDEMDVYNEIHCETYRRTGASPFPKEYFWGIYIYVVSVDLAKTWVVVDKNDNPVGMTNIGTFKKKGLYWTVCCRNEHFEYGVYYLLLWHAIESAKDNGFKWFDCAEAFPNVREGKLKGLNDFKRKFGGELHRYYKGRLIIDAHSKQKKEGLFRNWLECTALLLQPVLGEEIIKFVAGFLRRAYRFSARIYQFARLYRRVNFIKPQWRLKEVSCGLLYRDRGNEDSLKILIDRFSKKLNVEGVVIPTSSGRTALELALRVLRNKYPEKQKVIIPTYGCKGTFDPIINAGLIPIFADIDRNLNISKDSVAFLLKRDVLAVVVPHLCGCKAEIEEIATIAKEEGIVVIEDVCQTLGREDSNYFLGTRYDMSIFSFGMGKNLMATAGGILISNILKDEIYEKAKNLGKEDTSLVMRRFVNTLIRHFLKLSRGDDKCLLNAYEYNEMHPLDAKLISLQLDKLETILRKRRENAQRIIEALHRTDFEFSLQDKENHIYTKLSLIFENSEDCKDMKVVLHRASIETEPMYTPLHLRQFAVDFSSNKGLPYSEKVYKNVFNIPVRPNLSEKQLSKIITVLENANPRRN